MRNCCVTGWYYPQPIFDMLAELQATGVDVTVMAHRDPACRVSVPVVTLPDIGLEWGSFSAYLKYHWHDGETLFLHDDVSASLETILTLYRSREKNDVDLAFIFRDEAMANENSWHHGRAIIASDKYLRRLAAGPGIWYDRDNHGMTIGPGCNRGCHHFYFTMGALKEEDPTLRTTILLAPDMDFGFRGLMGEAGREASASRFTLQAAGA